MKKDLLNAIHICPDCNISMDKTVVSLGGHKVRGWKCKKCKEIILHTPDAQWALMLNKLKQGIDVKVGKLGESLIIRIPKEFQQICKIKKGESLKFILEDKKKISIKV